MKRAFLKSTIIVLLLAISTTQLVPLASSSDLMLDDSVQPVQQSTHTTNKNELIEENVTQISALLQNEDAIQYYAYLDLSTAEESLQPVILEARNRIIFRCSWVADGIEGFVFDENGKIVEKVPQFSDLFPSDWDEPIVSTEVDLAYYGIG